MRTIKFRGKRVDDGLWEYGWFYSKDGKYYIHDRINDTVPPYEVNPKTVGQFTGLYDSNEEEIYEGDVIVGRYGHLHVIRYNATHGAYTATLLDEHLYDDLMTECHVTQRWISERGKRVCGNVFDTPEYLKV